MQKKKKTDRVQLHLVVADKNHHGFGPQIKKVWRAVVCRVNSLISVFGDSQVNVLGMTLQPHVASNELMAVNWCIDADL